MALAVGDLDHSNLSPVGALTTKGSLAGFNFESQRLQALTFLSRIQVMNSRRILLRHHMWKPFRRESKAESSLSKLLSISGPPVNWDFHSGSHS